jgi:protein N-lysine methyltransferase METTL21A
VCYFCFKKRRKADWRFIKDMKKHFEVRDSRYDDQEKDRREGIYLFEVRRRSNRL